MKCKYFYFSFKGFLESTFSIYNLSKYFIRKQMQLEFYYLTQFEFEYS